MSVLTNFTAAVVRDTKIELDGRVLSRPSLLITDGLSTTYGCDVDIGITAISGYDQSPLLVNANNTTLRSVPIARGNRDVIYAEVGSAVRLRRTASGRFEIIGYSKEMPGKNTRYPVSMQTFEIGALEDVTITSRPLTLAELASFGGGFGITPLGAIATYRGGVFIELRT